MPDPVSRSGPVPRRARPRRRPPQRRAVAGRGLDVGPGPAAVRPRDHPATVHDGHAHLAGVRRPRSTQAAPPDLPGPGRRHRLLQRARRAAGAYHAETVAGPARTRRSARRPRRRPAHRRGRADQLARHAHALPALRRGHRGHRGRLGPTLPGRWQPALPAHRSGRDHARPRRRRPLRARAVRPAGPTPATPSWPGSSRPGVGRGRGGPRGVRGGRPAGHRRDLPVEPALALPGVAHARFHRPRRGRPDHRAARRRTRRRRLVHPRGDPGRRDLGRRTQPRPGFRSAAPASARCPGASPSPARS